MRRLFKPSDISISEEQSSSRIQSSEHRKKTPLTPFQSSGSRFSFRKLSPFEKVISKATVCKNILPNFCTMITSPKNPSQFKQGSLKVLHRKEDIYSDITKSILSEPPVCNFKINLLSHVLTFQDLSSLRPHEPLTSQFLDICLDLLLNKNRKKIFAKARNLSQIFIVPTELSNQIFNKKTRFEHSHKNLQKFKYFLNSLIIFPIFFDYWTVAVCDLSSQKIDFFDPVGIESDDKLIRKSIIKYLSSELRYESKLLSSLQKFKYRNLTESEVYDHIDSPIYVLMQVYKHGINPLFAISPSKIEEFRLRLLYLIFKQGKKLTLN